MLTPCAADPALRINGASRGIIDREICHTDSLSPSEQYSERLRERELGLARWEQVHARMGSARLGIGAVFLALLWLCSVRWIAPAWLLLPVASFIAALIYHQRVRDRRARAEHAVAFYRAGLGRLSDRWRGCRPNGERFADAHHIYASDLDLFGPDSLYELLCAARTQMGEATLARWLCSPADVGIVHERQAAIADLRDRLDLHEDLAILGGSAPIALHPEMLLAWAQAPNRLNRLWIRWAAPLLALLAVLAAIVWAVWGMSFPLLAVLLIEIAVTSYLKTPIREAIIAVESAFEDLKNLSGLMHRIESEHFDAPPLRALVHALSSHTLSASATFAKLATIVNFVEARRNPLLTPLLLLFMYPLQAALAAERWRSAHATAIPAWLGVLGEMESLVSLAQYSHEHPDDPFPEFVEGAASFQAADLGHPLIPAAVRVCNDVDISDPTRVLLVSGSNMSGKSTLLRTVGVNAALAMAGGPVRARALRMTPLRIGASIRINDSLHDGSSRFYAEITRLRRLFEPSPLPLLFLLDELLQGTNSADRRIGAQGVIRALIERGAIGLISTHDLALVEVPGLAPGSLVNVHFQDEFSDGRLKFDFRLRPGVVTKSNGLALMRSIGLDV
jgi:hypothetical protein